MKVDVVKINYAKFLIKLPFLHFTKKNYYRLDIKTIEMYRFTLNTSFICEIYLINLVPMPRSDSTSFQVNQIDQKV